MSFDRASRRTGFWVALAFAVVVTGSVAVGSIGALPVMAPWDVFIQLDGSWRILSGQVPHRDFHNPIGPLTYLLGAAGMALSKPSLGALPLGSVLFVLASMPVAIGSFFRRLPGLHALSLVAFLTLLAVAPRPLGYLPESTTYAMAYNRYGWVLLAILVVHLAVPPRSARGPAQVGDDLVAGVLLGVLLYCKANFFVAAVVLAGCSVLARRAGACRRLLAMATGVAAVGLLVRGVLDISVIDYLRDVASAARAQSVADRIGRLSASLRDSAPGALLALAVAVVASLLARARGWPRFEPIVLALLLVGASVFVTAGNTGERADLPLLLVAGVLAVRRPPAVAIAGTQRVALHLVLLATVVASLGAPIALQDLRAFRRGLEYRAQQSSPIERAQAFAAEALGDFHVPSGSEWPTAYWRAKAFPHRINEALGLLRSTVPAGRRIMTLAVTDPFSFALGQPAPRGGLLWWDLDLSFDRRSHPGAVQLFDEVDVVLVPVFDDADDGCCRKTVDAMLDLYGEHLRAHFVPVARSPHWSILERRR